jgi:hypothetical protein
MLADACLQPRVPLPSVLRAAFVKGVHQRLEGSRILARRLRRLYPLWALKWCLILLNEFVPSEQARRRFAGSNSAERRVQQLEKSRKMFHALTESLPHLEFLPPPQPENEPHE